MTMQRRVWMASLALALACAGKPAAAEDEARKPDAAGPGAGAAAAAPGAPDVFDPDDVVPFFGRGAPGGEAAEKFALQDWRAARDGFTALLSGPDAPKDPATRARAAYLLALAQGELGQWAEAAAGFDAVAPTLPLIADYVAYDAARAWFFARDLDKAAERAARVTAGSVRYADARLLSAQILLDRGKHADAAAAYAKYLADFKSGPRRAEARFRLATAEERAGRPLEALVAYRHLLFEHPLDSWATPARERFDALVGKLPKKKRGKYTTFTAAEHLTRAKVLFDEKRNAEAEKAYGDALAAKPLDAAQRCEATYGLGQSLFNQRQRFKASETFERAMELCAKTDNADLQMRAAYQAGRGYQYADAGDEAAHKKSIARFARAEEWHPEHSFADDARMRQAEGWARLPRTAETDAKITELLSKIPELYPQGDMRAEALWRLAWRAWKDGKYEEVIVWLDKAMISVPRDYNYWAEGQPQYWKARALDKLGRRAEALDSYRDGIRLYPLSYYSLIGLNRLREGWPKEFAALVLELKKLPPGYVAGAPGFAFKPRPVFAEPGFRRAVELMRLGLGDLAQLELGKLGLRPPDGRKQEKDADKAELLWATAVLYDRARQHHKSHWIARWQLLDWKDAWPTAANRARWEIAYPKAWWHLVVPAAEAQGYPPELLIAFMREESAFNPILESWANAIGLTQMIKPTAERFGKGLGFDMTRENLRDPAKNVAVGSRFLAYLVKIYDGRWNLIVPAYNAGEGAVWRWLCDRGHLAADEFEEGIAGDEPRNYTKRVLSSFFTYTYLEHGTVPIVGNDIPPHVINQKKCKKAR